MNKGDSMKDRDYVSMNILIDNEMDTARIQIQTECARLPVFDVPKKDARHWFDTGLAMTSRATRGDKQ
jgi:hypothetical protein